jgi:hypothetical protein
VGDVSVWVWPDFLALFSLEKYDPKDIQNLQAHLTNTCSQNIKTAEEEQV